MAGKQHGSALRVGFFHMRSARDFASEMSGEGFAAEQDRFCAVVDYAADDEHDTIVALARASGGIIITADAAGYAAEQRALSERCGCHRGSACDVSHDPALCDCEQCTDEGAA